MRASAHGALKACTLALLWDLVTLPKCESGSGSVSVELPFGRCLLYNNSWPVDFLRPMKFAAILSDLGGLGGGVVIPSSLSLPDIMLYI